MTVANLLSAVRLLLAPLLAYLLCLPWPWGTVGSAAVLALAGLTDVADGYLARRLKEETLLGRVLDPVADKVVVLTALAALAVRGKLPLWAGGVLAVKEVAQVAGGAFLWRRSRRVIKASLLGKGATVLLYLGIALAVFACPLAQFVVGLGILLSLGAGWGYLCQAFLQKERPRPADE